MMHTSNIFCTTWLGKTYLWVVELLYGPLAWAYDTIAWLVSFGYWSQWRLDVLEYTRPGPTLEMGFGTGELLIALSMRGDEVIGLELSPQMHQVTARKLRISSLTSKRVRARTEAMPFMAGRFDNLIATFPSQYILKQETLSEIRRVLKQQGRCVVLGLGVHFKSGLKQWLTHLWMGHDADTMIRWFVEHTEAQGLTVTRVDHQADAYTLPVLILERSDGG